MRASDGERQEVVDRLHRAAGAGRLDLDEADGRVTAAYAARFRDDLAPIVADLPPDDSRAAAPDWHGVWISVVWRLRVLVWGDDERTSARPTPAHCRTAGLLLVAAAVWFGVCAVLGALLVAG